MRDRENNPKCEKLMDEMRDINDEIESFEDQVSDIKRNIQNLKNVNRESKIDRNNMMTKFGVSKDLVVGSLVNNPVVSVLKGLNDDLGAPTEREIEEIMIKISDIESDIEGLENEIFLTGLEVRRLTIKRENIFRERRFLGC